MPDKLQKFCIISLTQGGIAMCVNGYFKSDVALGIIVILTIAAPVVYSYALYMKEVK